MNAIKFLKSNEDKSVNFVFDNMQEARFVQRSDDYFIVYLSSHDGCNKACRFCHLTQTKQTSFNEVTLQEYMLQAKSVFDYYENLMQSRDFKPAKHVNFNFMSRGEVFANQYVLNNAKELMDSLSVFPKKLRITYQFNFSTIMPQELIDYNLGEILKSEHKHSIYYSLYSLDSDFRKRWLPKAMDVDLALKKLAQWQNETGELLALHWALIEGENDSVEQAKMISQKVLSYGLNAKFNLVRYNPYSDNQGIEPKDSVLNAYFEEMSKHLHHVESRIVPRVGFDVKASCGMFVN